MAQLNARKNAMSCSVPRIRCLRALAMPSSSTQCNGMQYNTLQYNAMQCNAMQWHSPTLEKTLCHAPFLAYGVLGRSPCHPAPSSEHTVRFLRSFVYKTAAKPNPKKKRSVIYPSLHGVLERYNTMQCNAMQWHSPTLEKTLCHAPFLAYGV